MLGNLWRTLSDPRYKEEPIMRRTRASLSLAALLLRASAGPALAAPLSDNCTKDKVTVTCTTFHRSGQEPGRSGVNLHEPDPGQHGHHQSATVG